MNPEQTKIWIIFSGQADLPWLKILKPGFRHCLILLHDGRNWLTIDPMLNHLDVIIHYDIQEGVNFPALLRAQGHTVMSAKMDRSRKTPAPFMLLTCVEVIKRLLGLHKFFIFTPWQLYRHLEKLNANK